MEKKKYLLPEAIIIEFTNSDIILTSGGNGEVDDEGVPVLPLNP